MCGITGFAQISNFFNSYNLIKMTNSLYRRGPDDYGMHIENKFGFGMRRLSIIDVEGGKQPVWSNGKRYLLVFNGEIYNYKYLQGYLKEKGYVFESDGDAEVIVNLYDYIGIKCLNLLRGMFAVAIWDFNKNELILFRDHLGIKPLFYSNNSNFILFGSEIKSILNAQETKHSIDAQALDAFFAYTYIPAPLTIWKDIKKLPPAHYLCWKDGQFIIKKYWDLANTKTKVTNIVELSEAIDDSVYAHLVSDVEIGAYLSGGLDSSTIVTKMQQHTPNPIRSFSIRYNNPSHLHDETKYAQLLQKLYGFQLITNTIQEENYNLLQQAINAFDEPFADDSIIPSLFISELASKYVKVVLSGVGGDELFGGYNRYQGIVFHQLFQYIPKVLQKTLAIPFLSQIAFLFGRKNRKIDLVQRFANSLGKNTLEAYMDFVTAANLSVREELFQHNLNSKISSQKTYDLIASFLMQNNQFSTLKKVLYTDINTYLPEDVLAVSDRIGMWHSLEIRVPFSDKKLAEVAFNLADKNLVNIHNKKIGLKKAIKNILPKSIVNHPKQGFEAPTALWFRKEGRTIFKNDIKQNNMLFNLINYQTVNKLLEQHISGYKDNAKILFSIYVLHIWLDMYKNYIDTINLY